MPRGRFRRLWFRGHYRAGDIYQLSHLAAQFRALLGGRSHTLDDKWLSVFCCFQYSRKQEVTYPWMSFVLDEVHLEVAVCDKSGVESRLGAQECLYYSLWNKRQFGFNNPTLCIINPCGGKVNFLKGSMHRPPPMVLNRDFVEFLDWNGV
jgi:hypothetical protein